MKKEKVLNPDLWSPSDERIKSSQMYNFIKIVNEKYNLNIVPVYIERVGDAKFNLEFQEMIKPDNFENKIELTKKLNLILEEMIKRNPYQWIWSHNRWK